MLRLDEPLELARALIKCPSVTPADAGALDILEGALTELGFYCHRVIGKDKNTSPVDNLFARFGSEKPNFCFAGHTDVVPVGNIKAWENDPFAALIRKGRLYGRGSSDMKGAIAAFVSAVARFLDKKNDHWKGSISFLITGDEEGPAVNGTIKLLEWLKTQNEEIDACLVGEPTNPKQLGDMIKIGRRGSLNAQLSVFGSQGHVAYPHLAENPLDYLVSMMNLLVQTELDLGTEHFQPSNIEITSIDVNNKADNVIPAAAQAKFNIRFNDKHTSQSLEKWLKNQFDTVWSNYRLDISVSGEAFITPPGNLSTIISESIEAATGRKPELSTTGGTSDARFIKDHCPVAEFGLTGKTMHKVNEYIELSELYKLTDIYEGILQRYFSTNELLPRN